MYGMNEILLFPYLKPKFNTKKLSLLINNHRDLQSKMLKISSHLILTQKQKEQLCSLPVSKFTDRKWESQNDATSFLKVHNLILENKPERKWKVRYSNKAKGICLLQCCCGSDASLRPKNGNSKARKSRQIYKFVGCLAFARIKKYKNNCIHIFGYLTHSEDCQRQLPLRPLNETINWQYGFSTYYHSFYKKILDEEFPNISQQERVAKANELWNSLSDELRTSFIQYDEVKRLLEDNHPNITQ
ncbi:hypothetical protein GLOIN_2v1883656 [Rhizophagus irregularis DAOM 181602=DAOM 197198]|uniref:HMG box domain-containing protein n=2 Tax=Rhizophagus irregularis TaxID=588596 RepID=U9UPX4_RHIID|nr:hypothetical protein GLOIN_2v1883656 [Rhizophagus irregularis DAOM 181602=DAOM 197198]PKY16270.1 hypothetical protein RhiirB3_428610 [Rhizophagus irregularis]POG61325.1 hypothetical protein GLOIN_2v1883656 [Rhizophagus irregularis DAOM 181602=DAOM 197198]|eukprot:XP_025168191.1 hypothetical protein GLOIN_2v1883656 [Rhizophagus irregularis DAOM 181602=DAOM 197198]